MEFTAWYALVQGEHFFWYLSLVIVLVAAGYSRFKSELPTFWLKPSDLARNSLVPPPSSSASQVNKSYYLTLSLRQIILHLQQERSWAGESQGEALMIAAVVQALHYIQGLDLSPKTITTAKALIDYLSLHPGFEKVFFGIKC